MVRFSDALTLDAPRRTSDGYLAVRARASRTGVYQYSGREVDPDNAHGLRDQAVVNVLRDDATVFDEAAARSFIGKPVTDDHPNEPVTAANWRDHSRGTIMGALRDGDYLAFDLLLTDAATIAKVDAGKRELSNGYGASLAYGTFTAKDGTVCQARQEKITGGNHVALVDRGRAGSECAIKDGFAVCDRAPHSIFDSLTTDGVADAKKWLKKAIALHKMHMNGSAPTTGAEGEKSQMLMMKQMENALAELDGSTSSKPMKMDHLNTDGAPTMKTMLIDGLTVDVSNADTAMATITTLIAARDAATGKVTGLEAKSVADAATIVAKDAEIAKLTADVAAAKPTLQQLRDAGKQFAVIEGKAKAMGVTVTDAMDEAAIMKAVVDKAMGDKAKDYTADHIAIAFEALTKDAKVADATVQPLGSPVVMGDAAPAIATARAGWLADKRNSHRNQAA